LIAAMQENRPMWKRIPTAAGPVLFLLLAGCASSQQTEPASVPASPVEAAASAEATGGTVAAVVGTPFLMALKIPACAASLPVVGVMAGLTQLSADPDGPATRRELGYGLASNCGPPYWVEP
jgi:hypothetical protein